MDRDRVDKHPHPVVGLRELRGRGTWGVGSGSGPAGGRGGRGGAASADAPRDTCPSLLLPAASPCLEGGTGPASGLGCPRGIRDPE